MVGEPQGTLLALWVKECGGSECPAVMDGIRAETLPDAKAGRLPRGHSWRENFDKSLYEERQMTATDATDESGLVTGSVVDYDQSVWGGYEEAPMPSALL